jgi:hypothetical protein
MRIVRAPALLAALLALGGWNLRGQAPDAARVLAAAREALDGDKALAAVRSFVATGRTRQIRGNNLVPIEFEISCELPDKFVRKDEVPAQDTDSTVTGFRGNDFIQFPAPPPGRGGGGPPGSPSPGPAQQRLTAIKQEFARLTLGAFAGSFPSYPLTFTYAAEGEAPEGKADVLDVTGPANFAVRFIVQRDTHLPVMLIWQMPATNVIVRVPDQPAPDPLPPGAVVVDGPAPPASTAAQTDREAYATAVANLRRQALAQAKPVDYRMYYADYRNVNGMKWPFRIRRAVAGTTIEEITFDRISLNVKIDPRKFEAPK